MNGIDVFCEFSRHSTFPGTRKPGHHNDRPLARLRVAPRMFKIVVCLIFGPFGFRVGQVLISAEHRIHFSADAGAHREIKWKEFGALVVTSVFKIVVYQYVGQVVATPVLEIHCKKRKIIDDVDILELFAKLDPVEKLDVSFIDANVLQVEIAVTFTNLFLVDSVAK
jgi:hypothetical protein